MKIAKCYYITPRKQGFYESKRSYKKERQEFVDKRSQVEKQAEKLISECRFEEAMALLAAI